MRDAPSPKPSPDASLFSARDRLVSRAARAIGLGWITSADYQLVWDARDFDAAAARRALLFGARPNRSHPSRVPIAPPLLALLEASRYNSQPTAPMARLLLDAGAHPDSWGALDLPGSPIHLALELGQWETAELLISRSQCPLAASPSGQPVMGAVWLHLQGEAPDEEGACAALRRLARAGADLEEPCVDACFSYGAPPLLLACFLAGRTGSFGPALTLLSEGANPTARNIHGHTAACMLFYGLRHRSAGFSEPLLLDPSLRELLASLAGAGLSLTRSAELIGLAPFPQRPEPHPLWLLAESLERVASERSEMESLLAPSSHEQAPPAAPSRRL